MSSKYDEFSVIEAPDFETWYQWLEQNHEDASGVWLLYYKKAADQPSIVWEEAVRGALCFGWIDTTMQSIDELRYRQVFVPRKKKSTWSAVNKAYIEELTAQGLMRPAGQAKIDRAVEDGSWTLLDDVEALIIPDDLGDVLDAQNLHDTFRALSRSRQKQALYRLFSAKRQTTRDKRITEILESLQNT